MADSDKGLQRQKMAHNDFWGGTETELLRTAGLAACKAVPLNYPQIRYRLTRMLGDEQAPSDRTISRFLNGKVAASRDKPMLTALCHALHGACAEQGDKFPDPKTAAILQNLYERTTASLPDFEPPPYSLGYGSQGYTPKALEIILAAIEQPPGEDDPKRPEFPPCSPRFPATPTEVIQLPGRSYTILVKDESFNPTGSHKDRWAWEKLLQYKKRIEAILRDNRRRYVRIPPHSMISAGSAAYALQNLLRFYGLPPLRVVMDETRTPDAIIRKLQAIGAIVYRRNLETSFLHADDVLKITDNYPDGIEVTTRDMVTPGGELFYDWLVCEILQYEPTYIFVPVGSGALYTSIITFLEKEEMTTLQDKRLSRVDQTKLRGIHILGATTYASKSRMDKLYAKFRPALDDLQEAIGRLKANGIIGDKSAIIETPDPCAAEACDIAERQRIRTELSGIAGLGLLLHKEQEFGFSKDDVIMVVNTGWMFAGHNE